jgi:hypothetical protein
MVFALGTLTRETSAVFPLFYGLQFFWQPREAGDRGRGARAGLTFLAMALAPLALYKVFLTITLGSVGVASYLIQAHPFAGILDSYPWGVPQTEVIRSVYAPAVICGAVSIWALVKDPRQYLAWLLLANVVLFAVLLAPESAGDYTDTGRIAAGIVLAALLCIPSFDLRLARNRWWLWTSGTLWLSLVPFWFVLPIADSLLHPGR